MKSIIGNTIKLTIVCAAASGLLAYIYQNTSDKIKENEEKEKIAKVKTVLPEDVDDIKEVKVDNKVFYEGYAESELKGTVVEVSEIGYGGAIKILAGMDAGGSIIAINILSHNETPGLGSKIQEDKFKDQFEGRVLKNVVLKKDDPGNKDGLDAITAATISSRAVVRAVRKALEEFKDMKNE